jgi:hypothetical protein
MPVVEYLWELPTPPVGKAQPKVHRFRPLNHTKRCLRCGKHVGPRKLFCCQSHQTAWQSSMSAYTDRLAQLKPPPEQREIA